MDAFEAMRLSVELFGWLAGGATIGYLIDEQIKKARKKRRKAI